MHGSFQLSQAKNQVAYLAIKDSALLDRIRNSRIIIFRAICQGKTNIAILENTRGVRRCAHKVFQMDIAMDLSDFHKGIRPGKRLVFHEEGAIGSADPVDIIFNDGPVVQESTKATFKVEMVVSGDGFCRKNPLIDGPAHDMD